MSKISGFINYFDEITERRDPLITAEIITESDGLPRLRLVASPLDFAEIELTPEVIRLFKKAVAISRAMEGNNGQ